VVESTFGSAQRRPENAVRDLLAAPDRTGLDAPLTQNLSELPTTSNSGLTAFSVQAPVFSFLRIPLPFPFTCPVYREKRPGTIAGTAGQNVAKSAPGTGIAYFAIDAHFLVLAVVDLVPTSEAVDAPDFHPALSTLSKVSLKKWYRESPGLYDYESLRVRDAVEREEFKTAGGGLSFIVWGRKLGADGRI
jgi:hypothetical protein